MVLPNTIILHKSFLTIYLKISDVIFKNTIKMYQADVIVSYLKVNFKIFVKILIHFEKIQCGAIIFVYLQTIHLKKGIIVSKSGSLILTFAFPT